MHWIDWLIVGAYLVWMVYDGLKRTESSDRIEGYFLANRSLPWWAVGLSVMATQLSAITLVGTTGQGYSDGMRFVQFYLGLPIAMIILSLTAVPFFYRARVFTAYEYLERRFDAKTRMLASALFLASRGLSCGVIVAAPAVILSIVLGWNLTLTVLAIGLPTIVYTVFGGVQAVTWTDVKQMVLIVFGLFAAVAILVFSLPPDVGWSQAMHLAGSAGRLNTLDFSFSLRETYTFWSGILGGLFLMLSYFGCDQSQVQRYLTAKSIDEGRSSLMMSAFVKIPLQALVLLTGVLVFVFYLFNQPPMLFNPAHDAELRSGAHAGEYTALQQEFSLAFQNRRTVAEQAAAARRSGGEAAVAATTGAFKSANSQVAAVHNRAVAFVRQTTGDTQYNDVNYVFPMFVTTRMPIGFVGLMIAAIFAAAMSSIAAELNALATSTVIDFYRRHVTPSAADNHYLFVSRLATGFWGIVACSVAVYASTLGSLIEAVNRLGSFFYGSLLGVFMLAVLSKRATGTGAFVGLIGGMSAVAAVATLRPDISFLWYNIVGAVGVLAVGLVASLGHGRDTSGA
ncbi:MAG: sodium:solute symporter [Acidobacteria bacterium]|nr:sodium:solute symporter [Acidobacteriota bacterium]